jgi:O-methyltransferase
MAGKVLLDVFKQGLTVVGRNLSSSSLIQVQAAVNYLRTGRWMAERGFTFPERVPDRFDVFAAVARRVADKKVLYLEFGVAAGESMRWWSAALKNPASQLHGFDSFEGLPEQAGPWSKGQFSTDGAIPKIDDSRVTFHKGWFDQTLPTYALPPHDQLIVNLDADLYSSTILVMRSLAPHLKPGTFVYFDEMNHPDHEPKAFDEFVAETGITFRPVCADRTFAFVIFEVV